MKEDPNIHDPFAFLDEQPDKQEPLKHTPESIRARCDQLAEDARNVIPALRIIGVSSMTEPWAYQIVENELCNQVLSYLGKRCDVEASEKLVKFQEAQEGLKDQDKDFPTMEEMDIPESRSKDDEDEDF